ncbi:uncharacterized protein [Dermacentor albipictus]|uniref:uncharacterized protein n=1 Tax=Dermacentor albipictus TaxID=60249 RepID=UPI0031FD1D52
MPQRCAAVGCSNASGKPPNVRFFRFPAATLQATRRKKWVQAIHRVNADGSPWEPTANSRVCSNHFVTGAPSRFMPHPDYVPSVFKHTPMRCPVSIARFDRVKKRQASRLANASGQASSGATTSAVGQRTPPSVAAGQNRTPQDCQPVAGASTPPLGQGTPLSRAASAMSLGSTTCEDGAVLHSVPAEHEKSCQTDNFSLERIMLLESQLSAERKKVQKLEVQLKAAEEQTIQWKAHYYELKATTLCLDNMQGTEHMLYYTGLPSVQVFYDILNLVLNNNPRFAIDIKSRSLTAAEQMYAVLVRLRTGMATREIARNFLISMASFSRIFSEWVLILQKVLTEITSFPTLPEVQQHMPLHFRRYPNTRIILDTTEIRIQKPSSLTAQRRTFSHYKFANTMKCVVGATPDCYVSFVSPLYGGSTSDRAIVQQSGVLDLFESGDGIMVDKGFKVDDLLPRGVVLHMPPFRIPGEAQMSAKDVEATKHVASARVHIERVIRRIKEFHLLDRPLPINMLDIADAIFTTCAFLSNFRRPLINNGKEVETDTM